jgi:hypothetical protein
VARNVLNAVSQVEIAGICAPGLELCPAFGRLPREIAALTSPGVRQGQISRPMTKLSSE